MTKQIETKSTNISNHLINSLLLCSSDDINNKIKEEPDRMIMPILLTLHQLSYCTKIKQQRAGMLIS